jgi:hypothetical protein
VGGVAAADFTSFEAAQRAAGLPVTPERVAAFTLAVHAAIPHLLAGGRRTLGPQAWTIPNASSATS